MTMTSQRDAERRRRALAIGRLGRRRRGGALAPRSARSALGAVAILADRRSLLSPSAADVRRPAEPLKLSASCLAPLLVNAEKSRRAIVRTTRTQEPAEEAEAADERRWSRRRTRTRRGTGKAARRAKYNIGVSGTSWTPRAIAPGLGCRVCRSCRVVSCRGVAISCRDRDRVVVSCAVKLAGVPNPVVSLPSVRPRRVKDGQLHSLLATGFLALSS